MWSHKNGRGKAFWRCSVRERERQRRDYWKDPIGHTSRDDNRRRQLRIARMEEQLKEYRGI